MVRVSFVLVASVAGSGLDMDDTSSLLQAKISTHNQDQQCVHANTGDIAPCAGLFNGLPVGKDEVAPEPGTFCFENDAYALVQRSLARSSAQGAVEKSVSAKGQATPSLGAEAPEQSVSGKNAGDKTTATTTPTPTTVAPPVPVPVPVPTPVPVPVPTPTPSPSATSCQFINEPVTKYFWDPACETQSLGCTADGKNKLCRFCGGDTYVPCPTETTDTCQFVNEPVTKYFWDPACETESLGCTADGKNKLCRFCGGDTFVPCPTETTDTCQFANEPVTKYFWDPACETGSLGCMADGKNKLCRFCGGDTYVPCPTN